jgi:hypothetical protein
MRTLVQPPPSSHCIVCQGELQLKRIDSCGADSEFETEILVCIKCGHEHTYRAKQDPYAAHSGGK